MPYSYPLSGGQCNIRLPTTQNPLFSYSILFDHSKCQFLHRKTKRSVQECERVSAELKNSAEALLSRARQQVL